MPIARANAERTTTSCARSGIAAACFCAVLGVSQHADAQCTTGAPNSGGVVVNSGTQTLGGVSAYYDNALVAQNGAVVTTNGAVSGGGGICAETNANVTANGSVAGQYQPALNAMGGSTITANGPVTAGSGGGLTASGGATITLNGIMLQGTQGAQAMIANDATIIANGVTINWPNGYGGSLAEATNGGLIEFTANSTITIPSGGFSAGGLLADGDDSRITADGLDLALQIAAASPGSEPKWRERRAQQQHDRIDDRHGRRRHRSLGDGRR